MAAVKPSSEFFFSYHYSIYSHAAIDVSGKHARSDHYLTCWQGTAEVQAAAETLQQQVSAHPDFGPQLLTQLAAGHPTTSSNNEAGGFNG